MKCGEKQLKPLFTSYIPRWFWFLIAERSTTATIFSMRLAPFLKKSIV